MSAWASLPKDELLDLRVCDLDLEIQGTDLEARIAQLCAELEQRGFVFRPHFWLSDDWFCPDGVPGVAIPFYLAHPRLKHLEQRHMLEAEGGTRSSCMKLLRHETGHAIANAYLVHRRRGWRKHFGKSTQTYPDTYLPKPYSKRYVIHLDDWYAQSHPDEDWAETFAVWLKPHSGWRTRYRGWSALHKLEYVDELMDEIRLLPPRVRNRRRVAPVRTLRMTLREYYEDKQSRYGVDYPEFYDRHLLRLFSNDEQYRNNEPASHYIRRTRVEVLGIVSRWTSEYRYRVDLVIQEMMRRCDKLGLRTIRDDHRMKLNLTSCLVMIVMSHLHSGKFMVAL
ncbi:MAG: putative zinc-binding metallopeptidase [Gammaproteobacteria bacterium]|nr:putative zinc-binding metallopeptidase [Gammaproteobacteria bacterium]